MLKKLLLGLFILGMMCGAGFISAGSYSDTQFIAEPGDTPVTTNADVPKGKMVTCAGSNC